MGQGRVVVVVEEEEFFNHYKNDLNRGEGALLRARRGWWRRECVATNERGRRRRERVGRGRSAIYMKDLKRNSSEAFLFRSFM